MNDIFEHPNFNKIYFNNKTYTNDFLQTEINNFFSHLKKSKINDSPFVYLFATNHIKTVIAYFAIIKAGYIVVLMDPEIKSIELNERMQDTPPMALVKIDELNDTFNYDKEIILKDRNNIPINFNVLKDVCTIVYTAAEDGFQKGAMLTKKNLLTNAEAVKDCDEIIHKSVCCAILPFNHLFGLQTGLLAPMIANSSILLQSISDLRKFLNLAKDIKNCNVTNLYSVPLIYYLFTKVPNINEYYNSIKSCVSGGYKLSEVIFKNIFEKTSKKIHEGYGLTEASPVCSWHHPEDTIKIDSVGRPFSCCDIKIFNSNEIMLSIDEVGEICVKGDTIMKGYYNYPEITQKTIKNGWLHTGDLGKIDKDGYIYITGLKKNMLNVGGKNVYPKEVERLLKYNSNVNDVVIVGGDEGIQGHKIKAKVWLNDNSLESQQVLRKWCVNNISNYKIPKSFEFL